MKESMDVTIIKSLVKNSSIRTLLIDYCFNKYCTVETDNSNITIRSRYTVGEYNRGRQYIVLIHYSSSFTSNLSIEITDTNNIRVNRMQLYKPNTDFSIVTIVNKLIKDRLLRDLEKINYQLNTLKEY